jgi:hypothetical protein
VFDNSPTSKNSVDTAFHSCSNIAEGGASSLNSSALLGPGMVEVGGRELSGDEVGGAA